MQTLEDVAALWGWHSAVLELLRFPEGQEDFVSARAAAVSTAAAPPTLEARFVSCGNFLAGSELLSASTKPAVMRAAASVLLQPVSVRLTVLPEVRVCRLCCCWVDRDVQIRHPVAHSL